jgi:hypothetical protein
VPCGAAGTRTVTLDARHVSTAHEAHADFDCTAGSGRTDVLPLGAYDVTIGLVAQDGSVVSELPTGRANITRHSASYLGTVLFKIQSFALSWSICKLGPKRPDGTRACDPIGCAAAGGDKVELVAQLPNRAEPFKFTWRCGAGGGVTTAIPTGTYGLKVRLLNAAGAELSGTDGKTFVVRETERAVLPAIQFAVE